MWQPVRDATTAKLEVSQVRDILRRLDDAESQTVIAREYGVTRSCINDIARRKTWRWVYR